LLKLKRVELRVQVLPERTELRFRVPVWTALSSNGCGKSNLADASTGCWASSPPDLRGARMEDVIFAGTRDRKPLAWPRSPSPWSIPGFHFVGLAKTNGRPTATPTAPTARMTNGTNGADTTPRRERTNGTNGAANGTNGASGHGLEHGPREITLTRRLFRSGESEYLIDGRTARLRDIQDIFMGTGLGPSPTPSSSRVASASSSVPPQDRRLVIEEAAGSPKFKSRRRLAEARLEGASTTSRRLRHPRRGRPPGQFAQTPGRQGPPLRRIEDRDERQLRRVLAARYSVLEAETTRIALELNLATALFESLSSEAAPRNRNIAARRPKATRPKNNSRKLARGWQS